MGESIAPTNAPASVPARVSVYGAGSWGTALAILLARNGHEVRLWGRNTEHLQQLHAQRCNTRYLPEYPFPDGLAVTSTLADAAAAGLHVVAVPSQGFGSFLQRLASLLEGRGQVLWVTKGFEPRSGRLLHQAAREILAPRIPLAVLSGPTFAGEIAAGLPAAVAVAATVPAFASYVARVFHNDRFRVYISDDFTGVEVGGAVKNILAIAAGIADGLRLGANTRAALVSRGLSELVRLGVALGARRETLMGLSGLGDLVLTCTDDQSRNRRFGLALGQGQSVDRALSGVGQVVEGAAAAREALRLAVSLRIEMPITAQVEGVISGRTPPRDAVDNLLSRALRPES